VQEACHPGSEQLRVRFAATVGPILLALGLAVGAAAVPPARLPPGARPLRPRLLTVPAARRETRFPLAAPGYTVHFNELHSVADARHIVRAAGRAGARCLNVVPPARIWRLPLSRRMLDTVFQESERGGLRIFLTRLDACDPSGVNELFLHVLTRRARLPDGRETSDWFMATAGVPVYERWLAEETRYYSRRYGRHPALAGFAPGGFAESFVSQRGSIAVFNERHNRYEIAQYTPEMSRCWHRWLQRRFPTPGAASREYGVRCARWAEFRLPRSSDDPRYKRAGRAYFDFVTCLGDWWLDQYRRLHGLWHAHSRVPLIWQFNGFDAEKLEKGEPAFLALRLDRWLRAADAVGLSLYTYPDFPEGGHPAICATVRLLAAAVEAGKPLYVLEGGNETPAIAYEPEQLAFITHVALPLRPRVQIYEYFRYQQRDAPVTSGIMLDDAFRSVEPAYTAVQQAYAAAAAHPAGREPPWLYWLQLPQVARADPINARVNRLAYDAAGWLPLRMVAAEDLAAVPPGAWLVVPPDRGRRAGSAWYRRLGSMAAARGWHLAQDLHSPRCPGARLLDLVRPAQEEELEPATDQLCRPLLAWRASGTRLPGPGVVPRRGIAAVPLASGALVFATDEEPVTLDLRGLPAGREYLVELRAPDGRPRQVRLVAPPGRRLALTSPATAALQRSGSPGDPDHFPALPRVRYRIRSEG
jgi:hypothetical protein